MCGIAGAGWISGASPVSADVLRRMTDVLAHRGPDDAGQLLANFSDGSGVALGHRRLSIIDIAGGHQPLGNEDDSIQVVFNGEIYNYLELAERLQGQGHQFRTATDTEVLVHLYEEYGDDCVTELRGMFAFAIWDSRRRRLLLARDRLGQKPLVYREEAGRITFASELKALLQIPGAPREVDLRAVDQFLTYQYVPAPGCILQGYHKLPPGHRAVYEQGQLTVERYWVAPYAGAVPEREKITSEGVPDTRSLHTPGEWQRAMRDTLTEAVRLRMRSDVPLGAFLSGGIDSTIIVGLMQQHSDQPVHTFSIGFPVARFDERTYARMAAEHLGTRHTEAVVEPSALDMLPRLTWQYDEPFGDSSAIPSMYLSQMTRAEVKVSLTGDGGDELFAGYDRYRAVELASRFDRWPAILRHLVTTRAWDWLPASVTQRSRSRRFKSLIEGLRSPAERRYLKWISIFEPEHRAALYTDEMQRQLADFDSGMLMVEALNKASDRDIITRTSFADVLMYLPGDILTKVDIASMSYALECRSAFLDHHVAELAARMPVELKRRGKQGKTILIETFADLIPPAIRHRPKMGFGVPLDHWFRNELRGLVSDLLLSDRAISRGFFRKAQVQRLIDDHVASRRDHSSRLWALLCLECWLRTFIDPADPPTSAPQTV